MDSFDSLHDDVMELVLAHLSEYDLMDFATTSKTNERLVNAYVERWHTRDELEIFNWTKVIRASGNKLPPMPGYISDDSWSMRHESYSRISRAPCRRMSARVLPCGAARVMSSKSSDGV